MATSDVIADLKRQISSIESGRSFDSQKISNMNRQGQLDDGSKRAFKKIVTLVNHADRSEKSIRERLVHDGFCEDDIEIAVQKASDCGFIDDMRFAEVLIRSRVSQFKGSAGIVRELSEHGIEATDVPGWPHDFGVSHEEEIERALAYLRKKPPHSKNTRDGAYRKLVQRGFSSEIASSASRLFVDEERDLH